MRTKHLLSLLLIFSVETIFAQSFSPAIYDGIPSASKKKLYTTDFYSNSNNEWTVGSNEKYSGEVSDGVYIWQSFTDEAQVTWKNFETLDENSSFEIEASIKYISGKISDENALIWGKSSVGEFDFGFNGNGSYTSSEYIKGSGYTDIIPWTRSELINKNSFNVLTIRKVDKVMYFFVNKNLVHTMTARPFYGTKIGFQAGALCKMHIDYINIYQISKSGGNSDVVNIPRNTNNDVAAMSYNEIADSKKINIFFDDFNDNRFGWSNWNDYTNGKVENGHYYLESLNEKSQIAVRDIGISQDGDFEIETSIKFVRGDASTANFLQWGRKGLYESLRFDIGFTGSGKYTIDKYNGSDWEDFVAFTASSALKNSDYNKLTVRKIGSKYYFYINEVFVHTMSFQPFYGSFIGFSVAGKSIVYVDYLRVSKIKK